MSRLSDLRKDVRDIATHVDHLTYALTHQPHPDRTQLSRLNEVYQTLLNLGRLSIPKEMKTSEALKLAKVNLYVGGETGGLYVAAIKAGQDLEELLKGLPSQPKVKRLVVALTKNRQIGNTTMAGRPGLPIYELAFELKDAYEQFTLTNTLTNQSEPLESEGPIQ